MKCPYISPMSILDAVFEKDNNANFNPENVRKIHSYDRIFVQPKNITKTGK